VTGCWILLSAIAILSPVAGEEEKEPVYRGKKMSYWVKRAQYEKKLTLDYHDDGHRERAEAFGALIAIGQPAVKPLRLLLGHKQWYVRSSAASALGRIGPPAQAAVPDLLKKLKLVSDTVGRTEIPTALSQIDPKSEPVRLALVQALEGLPGESDPGVAVTAFLALEECRIAEEFSEEIVKQLTRIHDEHADPEIKNWASQLLQPPKSESKN
jgi:HEAT repeat protein